MVILLLIMINVLYIHGMGGGGDSRIPSILNDSLSSMGIRVIVRTYDFDPDIAQDQISSWADELKPELVIGESLGAVHAIRIKGVPHILISPSLNGPVYFFRLALLSFLPGVTGFLDEKYKPKEGDRQKIHFIYDVLRKYGPHRKSAISNSPLYGSCDYFHAFFGTRDHYMKSGIVSVRTWTKYFGDTFTMYEGSHFTEEEHIHALVIPKILDVLNIK